MSTGFNRVKIIKKQLMFLSRDLLENINVDIERFNREYPENVEGNIELYVTITGTEDTPWAGMAFRGKLVYGTKYPTNAPGLTFIDYLYHPNVYSHGELCISILHDGYCEYNEEEQSLRWSPAHTVGTILLSMISLFSDPNCESPANCDANNSYKKNRTGMSTIIREKLEKGKNSSRR